MKKINNNSSRGSSFLENAFPFWALDDDEIQEEDERIAAEAAARENIDNQEQEASASTDTKKDAGGAGSTSGGGTINIGSINIGGDVHVHMDDRSRRDSRSSRHSSDDDDVIDVDFVDVADRTTAQKKPAPTPSAPTPRLNQSSQLSAKQELTKFIRMGDFDALKELDGLIESGDTKKLIELFKDNRPLCFWIKRSTQQKRFDLLPVSIQNLVNQQTS